MYTIVEIHNYASEGSQRLSKKTVRQLLGIQQRSTLIENVKVLKSLGLKSPTGQAFTWEDVYELLALQSFCNLRRGSTLFTRKMYAVIRKGGIEKIKTVLTSFGIDLDQRFEGLKNDFNNQ